MTHDDTLHSLLERFVSGQTTEAEEAELARYFRTVREVPAEWQAYQELFASFDTDLYAFTEAELDVMAAPEAPVEMDLAVTAARKPLFRRVLRVAAMVAIAVGVGLAAYKGLVAPTPGVSPAHRLTPTAQVAQAPQAGQAETTPSVTPVPGPRRSAQASVRKGSVRRPSSVAQDAAAEALPAVEPVAEPTMVAQASPLALPPTVTTASCGSYADDDYEQLLAQFSSLRDIALAVDDADAPLMASTALPALSPSQPVALSAPQAASTGSPFDDDVVFSKIAVP